MNTPSIGRIADSRFFHALVRYAPSAALTAARIAASVEFKRAVARGEATRLRQNLKLAFDEKDDEEIEHLGRKHQIAKYEAQVILTRAVNAHTERLQAETRKFIEIDGEEILTEIKGRAGPAIIMSPHYGTFALACLRLIQEIGPHKRLNIFFDDPKKNATTGVFAPLFAKFQGNSQVLFNNRRAALQGLRALKNNEILTMMPDVYEVTDNHVMVPFLGRLSSAMTGTAFFALKTGAPIYPIYCYPVSGYNCRLEIHPAIEMQSSGDFSQDLYSLTASIFASIETQLRIRPEHWVYWNTLDSRFPSKTRVPTGTTGWADGFEELLNEVKQVTPGLTSLLSEISKLQNEPLSEHEA